MADADRQHRLISTWHRAEGLLLFVLTYKVVQYAGMTALVFHQLVNWDGLSALAHAADVLYREPAINLALIGFVEPPAPALLYLPLVALSPTLAQSGFFTAYFGAIILGLCAVLLNTLGRRLGLPWWLRYPLVAIMVLHPVSLSYAALGSPMTLLLFAILGMTKSLAAWGEEQHLRDLIGCSLYATVALLTRYEAAFVVAAAALYIGARCAMSKSDRYSRVEGTLIAFLLPIVYFGGLWIGANWLIMGDPWHSLAATFAGAGAPTEEWASAVLVLPLLIFPFCYALAYHELRLLGPWRGGAAAALLMVAAIAMPLLWPRLYAGLGDGASWWSPLASVSVTVLAASLVLAMVIAARYLNEPESRKQMHRPLGGTVVLAIAGVLVLVAIRPMGATLPTSAGDALKGYVAFAHSAVAEQEAAPRVAFELRRGRQVVIAGWPGFAIALFSGEAGQVTVLPEVRPDEKVARTLRPGDLLVLLEGRDEWDGVLGDYATTPEWTAGQWQGLRIIQAAEKDDAAPGLPPQSSRP